MDLRYQTKRLVDVARGLRMSRQLTERERWPPERLERYQQERLDRLVRYARERSPFYRERLTDLPTTGPVELGALPTLDKHTMMERFDDLVTDRRLRRDALLDHLDGLEHDALYLGEHRAMATSGSSGTKGLFVYDRRAWVEVLAQLFRFNEIAGVRPRLPRLRVAAIGGGAPTHMTRRAAATLAVGIHRVLSLSVTMPLERLVEELNAFQPDYLNAYPSVAVLLAEEKQAGRLRISPEVVSTSSELRTAEATDRIAAAFGVQPFDLYGTTEGLWGSSCEAHTGLHLYEDMCIVENVDDDGRPVPAGERGARLLVTNLFNQVQPLIRFELTDVLTLDPDPCPCGRALRRTAAIEGRADDVLHLPGTEGPVAVHPLQFSVVTADRDVREFQVVQRGDRLLLRAVLREGAAAEDACRRLRERVTDRLGALGVLNPAVDVETRERLERPPGGKLQIVVADRSRRAGAPV